MLGSTTSRGAWSSSEALRHINYLEMLAVHFALKTFRVHLEAKHATVMIEKKNSWTYEYKSLVILVKLALVIQFVRHDG